MEYRSVFKCIAGCDGEYELVARMPLDPSLN